jgi:C_GCAxxG_C_C family probable redox protein
MNITEDAGADLSAQYFSQGYHCSEAVTRTLLELVHGSADPVLMKAADAFMGGIAGTQQHICGAVSGGLIVLGSLFGRTQPDEDDALLIRLCLEYLHNFEANGGADSLLCFELRERRQVPSCTPYVQLAVTEAMTIINLHLPTRQKVSE